MSRMMALWFPDWPLHVVEAATVPAVIVRRRIVACSPVARRLGIRRGMRLLEAQSLCPELQVFPDDPARDARAFEPIVAGLDDVAPAIEVLRPGMAVVEIGAPARYHGSEETAAEMLLNAVARQGIDSQAGISEGINTAIIAARTGTIVPPGRGREFLATQKLRVLWEPALGCEGETLDTLAALGFSTLGQVAQLTAREVQSRLGRAGLHVWKIATGQEDRPLSPLEVPPDLRVLFSPEEPISRVDVAAFAARQLAHSLHGKLAAHNLVCHRLSVVAYTATDTIERTWRTRQALEEAATADRVRWQLEGWLTGGGRGQIYSLALDPVDVSHPHVLDLWDNQDNAAHEAAARVASLLGPDAVLQAVDAGGRSPTHRVRWVPFGEDVDAGTRVVVPRQWPGRIPGPHPGRAHRNDPVVLQDNAGKSVIVTAEALLSGTPAFLVWGRKTYRVLGWAGPWPVNDAQERTARLQVVGEEAGVKRTMRVLAMPTGPPESPGATGLPNAAGAAATAGEVTVGAESEKTAASIGWLLAWQEGAWTIEASYS